MKLKVSAIKEYSSDNNAVAKSSQYTSDIPTTDVARTIKPLQTSENVWIKIKDIILKYVQ